MLKSYQYTACSRARYLTWGTRLQRLRITGKLAILRKRGL